MRDIEFKKLEKEIDGNNFGENYKNINIVLRILSYFGNISSVFLAYFFMSSIISVPMPDNPIVVFISSIILLSGIELLKRDIFDKLSIQILVKKTIAPLLIFSLVLISASFYSTLTGANKFASKTDQIETESKEMISNYRDSINDLYSDKIELLEQEISSYKIKINEKDREQSLINKDLIDRGWITASQKSRNAQLSDEKKYLDDNIIKLENRIESFIIERDNIINRYEISITEDTDKEKKSNKSSSFIFVIFSTIIELIILGGIYFNKYYSYRTYKENKEKRDKDPGYQTWTHYDKILNIIYLEDTKTNQKLPSNKSMIEMCKINGMIVLPKEMTDFLKLMGSLNIIKQSGSSRYINKERSQSFEVLKKHFNIK